jgi:hypothetical protein
MSRLITHSSLLKIYRESFQLSKTKTWFSDFVSLKPTESGVDDDSVLITTFSQEKKTTGETQIHESA